MAELPFPVWAEREMPTMQVTDLTSTHDGYQPRLRAASLIRQEDEDFLPWVNENRAPIHALLENNQTVEITADDLLLLRGIQVAEMADVISAFTSQPTYPVHRILLTSARSTLNGYYQAVGEVTPELDFDEEEEIEAQFNAMLGLIVVHAAKLSETEPARMADSIADTLGQAAIGSLVDVYIQREPTQQYRWWNGYQWWYDGERYGALLQKAATTKLASMTRSELGITMPGVPHHDPRVEQYRRNDTSYYGYDEGAAMILDTINRAAGIPDDQPGIYWNIWEFGVRGRDEAARQEADQMIRRATSNAMSIEDLEAVDFSEEFPIEVLRQVEEAGKVPSGQRISDFYIED